MPHPLKHISYIVLYILSHDSAFQLKESHRESICFSVFLIHHHKYKFFLICFCPVCHRAAIILSAELISLLVILSSSSPYPLFSSNLFSSHPPFQSGSPWIDINEPLKEGGRRDWEEKKEECGKDRKENRLRKWEEESEQKKWKWPGQRETDIRRKWERGTEGKTERQTERESK